MDVIGGKWKPIILCNLRHNPSRPGELRRQIPGISQKMLTQQCTLTNSSTTIGD